MRRALLLVLGLGVATGCGADLWYFETNNLSGGPTVLIVAWSDGPVDEAESVRIVLARLELYGPDGVEVLSETRRTFELLDLQHGRVAQLVRTEVPSGSWDGLRFHLAPGAAGLHTIRIDGQTYALAFSAPGLEVVDVPYAMTLEADAETTVHVDFNLRMSIFEAGAGYVLAPRLEAVDPATAGWLLGTVEAPSGAPIASATVSAQQGGGEILSARTISNGSFRLGPLPPGTYALVVGAAGYAPGYVAQARVFEGVDSGGYGVVLQAGEAGRLEGTAPASAGLTVRVFSDRGLVAVAGVDPAAGGFALPALPVGTYTVELWNATGPIDVLPSVAVTPQATTQIVF